MENQMKIDVLGRIVPNCGKIHQNQEVYNIMGGGRIESNTL